MKLAKKVSAMLGMLEVHLIGFCYARKNLSARSVHIKPAH